MKTQRNILLSAIILFAASVAAPLASGQVVPTQESPANGAVGLTTTVTVRWVHFREGETYRVQVFSGSTPIVDAVVRNATGYTLIGLPKGATFTWRVNATKRGRTSAWSTVTCSGRVAAAISCSVISRTDTPVPEQTL